ncbi:guanine nucleotide-binding protein-like 3 homolog [Paramacrobiotus metropolitanus]|uniref:guanine nucleotide-binding protein-like 3 homolog n=1 Tax=Paramacrobiotus metropolitanus TaxID=2943436 RepID=UPI00244605FA|nr:guanine nucleotide-binding protein-like 3 homolog [Paramacrobiotus metropolitanus]
MVTKGFKKKKSKRVSSKQIRKVEKKVKEHNKKQKREAKKNPDKRKGRKKDPGVPNTYPFKEQLLSELAEKKRKDFEKKKQRKLDKKADTKKKRTLDSVVADAQKRGAAFQQRKSPDTVVNSKELDQLYDNSLKTYYKEVKKVIEAADVILEVLDARDPLGTRCQQLENTILQSGQNKRLVLVLNKCDLIPKANLLAWLKYLRQELPTIPFKASTQNQRSRLSQCRVPVHLAKPDLIQSSKCFGSSMLMKILGNYCRNKGISTSIRVGIVGLPNVGKSSIINSLKRKQSCMVGATPGVTKSMQEIHLDKHITLLDSPGVLFAKEGDTALVALRNAVKVDAISDPVEPVEIILKKCSKVQLMLHYKIPDFADALQFLALVALKRGCLKKGGIPDVTKVARVILQDWVGGKISYHTLPPEKHTTSVHLSSELVSTMSKEFDLDGLEDDEKMLVDEMPETNEMRTTAIEDLDVSDEEMEKSSAKNEGAVQIVEFPKSDKGDSDDEWISDDPAMGLEGNQQWSKQKNKILKRRQKLKVKRDKTATAMAKQMDSLLNFASISDNMDE